MNNTTLFIVDGNKDIGYGHISRCLVLAKEFTNNGYPVIFLQKDDSIFSKRINDKYPLFKVEDYGKNCFQKIKSIVEDYSVKNVIIDLVEKDYFKLEWIRRKIPEVKITTITLFLFSLADRYEHLSFFPDLSLYLQEKRQGKYGSYKLFAGPKYFVFRDEFKGLKKSINENARCILVTMGGTDPYNISLKVVQALCKERYLKVTIILSEVSGCYNKVKSISEEHRNIHLINRTDEMANLMLHNDLILLNGGLTRYEACLAKTPFIAISIHEKQFKITKNLTDLGFGLNLGVYSRVSTEAIRHQVNKLLADYAVRKEMSGKMDDFLDAKGAERIYNQILG